MTRNCSTLWACFIFVLFAANIGRFEARQEYHKNLSCYLCHTLTHGEFCQNFMLYQNTQVLPFHQCPDKELFCMVRRFSFSANGTDFKVWMMERNCTHSCRNECVITGDRSKLHLCTSCCEHNLCNIGNAGLAKVRQADLGVTALIFFLLALYISYE